MAVTDTSISVRIPHLSAMTAPKSVRSVVVKSSNYNTAAQRHGTRFWAGRLTPTTYNSGEQPFIISEKALKLFAENNVSGYDHAEPVTVEPRGMNKDGSPIDYFQLNICGRAELDFNAMFLKKKKYCAVCGQYEWNRQRFYPRVVDGNSWDGSDLARVVSIPGWILCSDKVRKIVKKHKLKGFVFTEARTSAQL